MGASRKSYDDMLHYGYAVLVCRACSVGTDILQVSLSVVLLLGIIVLPPFFVFMYLFVGK